MSRKRRGPRVPEKASAKAKPTRAVGRPARSRVAELGLGAFAFALYAVSLGNGLTNWDDPIYVTDNFIAAQGWGGLLTAFTHTFDHAYYPLTQVTYVLLH